jgi:VWFA-related protein
MAAAAAAPGARGGQQLPDDRPRFGTSTAAVVVDVIVRDRKGEPVVDLTQDDFEVFENGTPQRLIDFERVLPGSAGSAPVAPAAANPAMASSAGGHTDADGNGLRGQQVTAVVFDWLTDHARHDAWRAASTLVGQMTADDYVGVYAIDQALRRLVPYTRDSRSLKQAFDILVNRPARPPTQARGALTDSLVNQRDLPSTASAEYAAGANTLNQAAGEARGPEQAMAAMLERQLAWDQFMNRQQQGIAVSNALIGLIEELSGMPGRKTVVLFSEGLEIPDREKQKFDNVEVRANRHNVTFYTIDAAGLRVFSRMRELNDNLGEAGEQNVSTGIANDRSGRRTELMWRDPTAGLKPLAERTGGLYIGDTNDLAGGFAKVNADRRFHYLLAYASSNPALDGSYRRIDVRVRRAGVKVRARGGYVASPTIERTERRDYETPALAALDVSPAPTAFPFQPRALSTPVRDHPGMTSLVAAVEGSVITFREDTARRKYEGEVTVLARVKSSGGQTLATQSQLYRLQGEADRLDAAKAQRLLFFRTPDVPPGSHTVQWVVRDGTSSATSVLSSSVDVPLHDVRPVVGDLIIVDGAEKAPEDDPAMKEHPLVSNGMLLYPSLGLPISKASRRELTFFLPMLVDSGDPLPSTTLELLHAGRSLAAIQLPAVKGERGSLRHLGTLPIDNLPPGVYELKATVTSGERKVARTASFAVVP